MLLPFNLKQKAGHLSPPTPAIWLTQHGQDATSGPDQEAGTHGSRVQQHCLRGDEDARANDGPHNQAGATEQTHLCKTEKTKNSLNGDVPFQKTNNECEYVHHVNEKYCFWGSFDYFYLVPPPGLVSETFISVVDMWYLLNALMPKKMWHMCVLILGWLWLYVAGAKVGNSECQYSEYWHSVLWVLSYAVVFMNV